MGFNPATVPSPCNNECITTNTNRSSHPIPFNGTGGADALALARGRDCTALFESYHPFTDKPRQMLPKFLVPSAAIPAELVVPKGEDGFFLATTADGGTSSVRDPFWVSEQQQPQGRQTDCWIPFPSPGGSRLALICHAMQCRRRSAASAGSTSQSTRWSRP